MHLMLPLDMAVRLLSDHVRLNSRTNCVRLSISQNGVAQLRLCMRCISSGIPLFEQPYPTEGERLEAISH